jgi:plasmid maintenance system antidote protein VapI
MQNVHIGELIKKKIKERGIKITDFAKAIHCNRNNVYSIFRRKSIDIELLLLISRELEYDFITEIYVAKDTENKKYLALIAIDQQQLNQISNLPNVCIKFVQQV